MYMKDKKIFIESLQNELGLVSSLIMVYLNSRPAPNKDLLNECEIVLRVSYELINATYKRIKKEIE